VSRILVGGEGKRRQNFNDPHGKESRHKRTGEVRVGYLWEGAEQVDERKGFVCDTIPVIFP